jgi:integrase
VIIDREHIYLGKFGTPESREKYDRLIAEWLASKRVPSSRPSQTPGGNTGVTINELLAAFWKDAEQRYVKNGKPTSEVCNYRVAMRPVCEMYGRESANSFGPLALVACRQKLVDAGISRKRINQHLTRIRRVFKWAVAREIVPESVWRALCAVEGLRVGQAPEPEPVKPVAEEHVKLIEPFVTPQIWAMVQFQLWTGCRPGEASVIRTIDIKMDGAVWEYRPHTHKGEHHGKERVVYIGPHAQVVLKPWLKTNLHAYLFSPREARAMYHAKRAAERKTPVPPSQRKRKAKANPKRRPGEVYTVNAYDHAVRRACERAGVPPWSPNRLRHTAGTKIRAAYGIEAARVILGHSSAVTSEIYAEIDREKAREIMEKLG